MAIYLDLNNSYLMWLGFIFHSELNNTAATHTAEDLNL